MNELADRLKELDAKATKGPWSHYLAAIPDGPHPGTFYVVAARKSGSRHMTVFNVSPGELLCQSDKDNSEMSVSLRNALPALIAYVEASEPFITFADKWDANPLSQANDILYSIHNGDIGAEFRLSDCKKLRSARAALEQALGGEGK